MEINKYCSVCFSGYRPEKFPFSLEDKESDVYKNFHKKINESIIEALRMGYNTFFCGMAKGFDLLCGKAVLDICRKIKYNHIQLIAVLPFANHGFSGDWGRLHRLVRHYAKHEIIIAPNGYTRNCYYLRNRFMVENSTCMICYWDGQEGGTAQAVRMAIESEHILRNLGKLTKGT